MPDFSMQVCDALIRQENRGFWGYSARSSSLRDVVRALGGPYQPRWGADYRRLDADERRAVRRAVDAMHETKRWQYQQTLLYMNAKLKIGLFARQEALSVLVEIIVLGDAGGVQLLPATVHQVVQVLAGIQRRQRADPVMYESLRDDPGCTGLRVRTALGATNIHDLLFTKATGDNCGQGLVKDCLRWAQCLGAAPGMTFAWNSMRRRVDAAIVEGQRKYQLTLNQPAGQPRPLAEPVEEPTNMEEATDYLLYYASVPWRNKVAWEGTRAAVADLFVNLSQEPHRLPDEAQHFRDWADRLRGLTYESAERRAAIVNAEAARAAANAQPGRGR